MGFNLKTFICFVYPDLAEHFEDEKVVLVRHKMTGRDWSGFDELIKFDYELLRVFTAEQKGNIFHDGEIIITFVATRGTKCLMRGAFRCREKIPFEAYKEIYKQKYIEYARYRESQGHNLLNNMDRVYYRLEPFELLSDFSNRLVIDWGKSAQAWYQRKTEKEIIELLPRGFVSKFPGWQNVLISHQELKSIVANPDGNRDWYQFLTEHDGVYLILDSRGGKRYVGSAYGAFEGVWGRWCGYAKNGHNGNLRLVELLQESPDRCNGFLYSLHYVCARSPTSKREVLFHEALLKKKLGTRSDEELNN